jgi:hypothetical protein
MTPSEIISADLQSHGNDPQEGLRAIAAAMHANQGILLQENNSILYLRKIGKGIVELHLFTQDSPLTVAKSAASFIKKIRNSDLKKAYGNADNEQIVELLRRLKVDVKDSDKPQYNWMAKV